MKRIILMLSVAFLFVGYTSAQSDIDALRFSQTFEGGTARSLSMGGAFSSLGVDLSVLATNPAGLAFSRNSYFVFTPQLGYTKTNTLFNDASITDDNYNFKINNIGFTKSYVESSAEKGWLGASFGVAYNKLKNFNSSYIAQGVNNNSSMLDHFMYNSDGNNPDNFYNENAIALMRESYAWSTWLLDTVPNTNNLYWNPIWDDGGYGQTQQKIIERMGNIGEYSFAFAANYSDMFYIGATFGIQNVYFKENIEYSEFDEADNITKFKSFTMREMLTTTGSGYNFKLGIIVRPIPSLRISAAFHTPTFYSLHDSYSLGMEAHYDSAITTDGSMDFFSKNDGDLISELVSDYQLRSAPKILGGVSLLLGHIGLISVDYEYVDYGLMDMSADDYNYVDLNAFISENYSETHTVRLGTEIIAIPGVAVRAGAIYSTSPQGFVEGDYNRMRMAYSGGIGLNSDNVFLDLAVMYEALSWQQYAYTLPSDISFYAPIEKHEYENISFVATLGFRF